MEKDLTKGKPWKILLHFTIPLFIGTLFQQIYNIADTIVIGNFIGSQALAAVRTSGVIMNMISGAGLGLATGCCVIISQYVGAKKLQERKCDTYFSSFFSCYRNTSNCYWFAAYESNA